MGKKRKKKATQKEESKESSKAKSKEVSIDVSKLVTKAKGLFSSNEKSEKSETPSDSVNIDAATIKHVLKKYGFIFLILIPIVLGVSIRMQTEYLPMTYDWARNSVHDNVRAQMSAQIQAEYPNLPPENRNRLINKQFNEFMDANGDQLQEQIDAVYQHFKGHFQDDTGNTYMPDIDPYHFMRHARNIVEKGTLGDYVDENGMMWDDHMVAPRGQSLGFDVHPHVLANFYKIAKIFNPSISLMRSSSFFPIVVMILSVIPLFFLTRKLGGDFGALVTCILFVVNYSYLNRSLWGHADTDSYNLLFPIVMTLLFSYMIDAGDNKKRLLTFAGLSGLAMGIYSATWGGWWFMLNIMTLTLIALFVYSLLERRAIKQWGLTLVAYVVSCGVFVSLIKGNVSVFMKNITFSNSASFTQIKAVAQDTVWPNVLTTVAELNAVDLNGIIANIANPSVNPKLMFFLACMGMIVLLLRNAKGMMSLLLGSAVWYSGMGYMQSTLNRHLLLYIVLLAVPIAGIVLYSIYKKEYLSHAKYSIFLVLWIGATIYASTKGIRFVMLMVPAFTMGIGILFGYLFENVSKLIHNWIKIKPIVVKVLLVIAVGLMLNDQIDAAYSMGKGDIPSVNDAWFNSLDKIDREGAEDAIITSWWDFGHWFKWYADRAVTFDGASQNLPQAHWVGKALLTSNEKTAVGILRMLHCGAQEGFDRLMAHVQYHPETIDLLNEIFVVNRDDARGILSEAGVPADVIDGVLEKTHCDPPEAYFIASGDMVGKAGVWAHFGSWDFNRAQMYHDVMNAPNTNEALEILQTQFGLSEEVASSRYNEIQGADPNQWISGWPNYVSGQADCRPLGQDYTIECPNGFGGQNFVAKVNFVTGETLIGSGGGDAVPHSMGLVGPDGVVVTQYNNSGFPYAPLLIPSEGGNFKSIFMDPLLLGSMFTKMYYLQGHSLEYFDLFSYERDLSGLEIYVYKVDWEGTSAMQVFKNAEDVEQVVELEAVTGELELASDPVDEETDGVAIEQETDEVVTDSVDEEAEEDATEPVEEN